MVYKLINKVFPQVDRQLEHWISVSHKSEDEILQLQALASISSKKFHAQGGSAYALYPKADMEKTVKFIVALQTISDYLDNLCDRAGVSDEAAFRQLHLSMLDAVDPARQTSDYYKFYPFKNDGGYLKSLVDECRLMISDLPAYKLTAHYIRNYVQLYTDLQSLKHLDKNIRQSRMLEWAGRHRRRCPDLTCWEFSAAAGSTLGIFVLFAAAHDPRLNKPDVKALDAAYFPWISALHILLDYYIDFQEDMETGDLNFTYYYETQKQCEERLSFIIDEAVKYCYTLQYPEFHLTIIRGLLAMYLSDPKAHKGMNKLTTIRLLDKGEGPTKMYYNLCRMLRVLKKI